MVTTGQSYVNEDNYILRIEQSWVICENSTVNLRYEWKHSLSSLSLKAATVNVENIFIALIIPDINPSAFYVLIDVQSNPVFV